MALSRYGKADKIYDDGTGLLSAIVRRFKVDGQYTTVAQLPTAVFLAYETADEEHDDCLLAHQDVKSREGADPQESILTRVYVQIPADAATLVQIGNDLVTYSENGLKMVEQRFFGKRTHSLAGTVGTTTGASGDINTLILTSNGFAERGKVSAVVVKRWAEAGILSVRTPLVGGQQTVSVSAIGMTEAAVTTALASVTTTHVLINQTVGSYLGFQTKEFTYEVDDFETRSKTENGLQLITQTELGTANYTDSTIGVVGTGDYLTLYRAGETIDNGNTIKKRVTRWAEAGTLQAYKGYQKDGLLLITFESQGTAATPTALNTGDSKTLTDPEHEAFTGGAAAPLFRSRIINVNGFRRYIRSVLLLKNGQPLVTGSTLTSKQVWHDVEYPGYVNLSRDKGIEPYSGSVIPVKATLVVKLTTDSDVGTAPYSIKSGAYAEISFIPTETGIAQSIAKALGTRYLGGETLAGGGGTFLGADVTGLSGSVSSSPTYSVWLALSGQKLEYQHVEAFVTDEGTQWYRETTLTLIGAFSDYN